MIVDDDRIFLEELQEILNSNGYEAEVVSDPMKAVARAKECHPDLILLDLKMPGKSGFQLADELKHRSEVSSIPIIAISGFFTDTEHALLMNLCGIRQCIKKPFSPAEMISQINLELNKQNGSATCVKRK